MKFNRIVVISGVVAALALGLALAAPATQEAATPCADQELCAKNLRFGQEAFTRGKYREAKAYFRDAVKADPASIRAWSYYDLSVMYDVAQQVKMAGSVQVSDAPTPSSVPTAPAPAPAGGEKAPEAAATPAAPPAPSGGVPAVPLIKPDEGC
ncbi:MAG: hypothetical protein KQJ78_09735 [Deltaproteobacteria bacterium]|nr:hypothetical protein [Deltaproteobacteria bacterium]